MNSNWYLVCLLPVCQHQILWVWGHVPEDHFTWSLNLLPTWSGGSHHCPQPQSPNRDLTVLLTDSWPKHGHTYWTKSILSCHTWPKVTSSQTKLLVVCWRGFYKVSHQVSQAAPPLMCPSLPWSWLLALARLHLSSYVAPHLPVVIPSVSLLWLHPQPLMLRGWHLMPLMWPWPMSLQSVRLIQEQRVPDPPWVIDGECALCSHPPFPTPWLGGQHNVSWAHLCGAHELHLTCRNLSYPAVYDSLGDTTSCAYDPTRTVSLLSQYSGPWQQEFTLYQTPAFTLPSSSFLHRWIILKISFS